MDAPLGEDVSLFTAAGGDTDWLGGVCTVPDGARATLGWSPELPDRLLRQLAEDSDAPGVSRLCRAYLSWRLSTTDDPVAEVRRQQVYTALECCLIKVFCGSQWLKHELDIRALAAQDPWTALLLECERDGELFSCIFYNDQGEERPIRLSSQERRELLEYLRARMVEKLPDLWQRFEGEGPVDHDLAEALDGLFLAGYEELARRAKATHHEDRAAELGEVDPSSDPATWMRHLQRAKEHSHLLGLSDLLCPTSAASELIRLDYGRMSTADVVEELAGWVKRHRAALQGRRWEDDEIEAAVSLWLDPTGAVQGGWQVPLERLTTDRWTARAVRYAALRHRAARSLTSGVGGQD
jgi:hypothetical protein